MVLTPSAESRFCPQGHEARCSQGQGPWAPPFTQEVRLRLCHLQQHQECAGTEKPNLGPM